MYQAALTRKSSNVKTGPIPVSVTSRQTCPTSCPLDRNGCYADAGYYTRLHWDKVTDGQRGASWADFCADVRTLPAGSLFRHNVAGDLPGIGDYIAGASLAELADAASHLRGFTYTHKPPVGKNLEAIRAANDAGFTVNLSADTLDECDDFLEFELPVVTLLPADAGKVTLTPAGRKVVRCPAVAGTATCATCGLCARRDRTYAIGFPVHGAKKAAAGEVLEGEAAMAVAA